LRETGKERKVDEEERAGEVTLEKGLREKGKKRGIERQESV
jgi:hypothetical protein